MAMNSPQNCVALLAQYLTDEMRGAKNQLERFRNWEAHPHSHFYSVEGIYNKVTWRSKTKLPAEGKPKKKVEEMKRGTCIYHLGSQIIVIGKNG